MFPVHKFVYNPLTYVSSIASYVDINIFANFDNCFFKLIVAYSVGNAGKFNAVTAIVLLVLRYLYFQAFNLFNLLPHTVFWIAVFLDKR